MRTKWKPVKGCEDRYLVSSGGGVKSVIFRQHRMLSFCRTYDGYRRVGLTVKKGKGHRMVSVARLVAIAFLPPPTRLDQTTVNHVNGEKTDDRVENLEWASPSEQAIHRYNVLGVEAVRGVAHGLSKLTDVEVRRIRRRYECGSHSYLSLAKEFAVSDMTIRSIILRRTWTHL